MVQMVIHLEEQNLVELINLKCYHLSGKIFGGIKPCFFLTKFDKNTNPTKTSNVPMILKYQMMILKSSHPVILELRVDFLELQSNGEDPKLFQLLMSLICRR